MTPSCGPLMRIRSAACTPFVAPSVSRSPGIGRDAVALVDELGDRLADEPHALALGVRPEAVPGALRGSCCAVSITSVGKSAAARVHQVRVLAQREHLPQVGQRLLLERLGIADVAVDDLASLALEFLRARHDRSAHGVLVSSTAFPMSFSWIVIESFSGRAGRPPNSAGPNARILHSAFRLLHAAFRPALLQPQGAEEHVRRVASRFLWPKMIPIPDAPTCPSGAGRGRVRMSSSGIDDGVDPGRDRQRPVEAILVALIVSPRREPGSSSVSVASRSETTVNARRL